MDQSCGATECVNACPDHATFRTCPLAQKARKARYNASRQRSFRRRREAYIAQLEFFTAILLACSENRTRNLEALEAFVKDLKDAAQAH